jgi:hypothetical protein
MERPVSFPSPFHLFRFQIRIARELNRGLKEFWRVYDIDSREEPSLIRSFRLCVFKILLIVSPPIELHRL